MHPLVAMLEQLEPASQHPDDAKVHVDLPAAQVCSTRAPPKMVAPVASRMRIMLTLVPDTLAASDDASEDAKGAVVEGDETSAALRPEMVTENWMTLALGPGVLEADCGAGVEGVGVVVRVWEGAGAVPGA